MKRSVQAYTFSPGGAGVGTVTFTGYATISLDKIVLIENFTRGVTIYNPFDPTKLGTVATNVLTLAASTTGYSSGDALYIIYDDTHYSEDLAHVSGDLGTQILGVRTDAAINRASSDGDYSPLNTDVDGRLWVNPSTQRIRKLPAVSSTNGILTLTATTGETTFIAGVASESHDIYGLVLTNTGTSSTKVTLRDDTAGAGLARIFYVPALSTVGFTLAIADAIPQTAQNKPWTLQCGTSTSSLEAFALYVKVT